MIPSHYRFFKSDVNVHRGRFAEIKVDEAKAARDRGDEYSVGIFVQGELIWGANIRDGMTGYLSATFRSSGQPFAGYKWERKEDRMHLRGVSFWLRDFPESKDWDERHWISLDWSGSGTIRKVVNGRGCVATKEWTCPAEVLTLPPPDFGDYTEFESSDLISYSDFCIDPRIDATPNKRMESNG